MNRQFEDSRTLGKFTPEPKTSAKTYDVECYRLAEHFLLDEPCFKDPVLFRAHCHSLAIEIQQTVEDWFYEPAAEVTA